MVWCLWRSWCRVSGCGGHPKTTAQGDFCAAVGRGRRRHRKPQENSCGTRFLHIATLSEFQRNLPSTGFLDVVGSGWGRGVGGWCGWSVNSAHPHAGCGGLQVVGSPGVHASGFQENRSSCFHVRFGVLEAVWSPVNASGFQKSLDPTGIPVHSGHRQVRVVR